MDEDGTPYYYQVVHACGPVIWERGVNWLSEQIGYEYHTGETVISVDQFQFILLPNQSWELEELYNVVATCTIAPPNKEEQE